MSEVEFGMEQATETAATALPPAAAAQPAPETTEATPPAPPAPPAAAVVTVATAGRGEGKRKRGRPRKYGVDGGPVRPLKATPISASVPDDSGGGQYTPAASVGAVMKRGRGSGRPVGFVSRAAPVVAVTAATPTAAVVVSTPPPSTASAAVAQKQQLAPQVVAVVQKQQLAPQLGTASGDVVGCASGANFTPHILNVIAGEDINMKVISFSQQGPRAICILSANGMISNVTLRQHDSLGGTVTYEGRFELLSLSGSFTPTDNGGTRDRSGGMSVSLAAADGRVIGGGVAGLLVAASPVQVVVGSFVPSYQMDQNAKKPVVEMKTVSTQPSQPAVGFTISSGGDMADSYSGSQQPKGGNSTSAFRVENWTAHQAPPAEARRTPPPSSEVKVTVPGG
ncbi:hypothetical protein QYE76_019900 [Lolium multiflorum]|uniref:AT-hook motif nuclear-localized protein n=1 Tax=Lolium multiflorum TaxID=4521 RepID=A0AAD8R7T5_LOLMU|nr:hypothetical protein QYE76_019900 [Lolium multiflorum]